VANRLGLRHGVALLGVAAVIAGLLPLYQRYFGRPRLRFPYLSRPIASAAYDALAAKPGWKKTQLEVASGIELNGLLRPPRSPNAPWVLYYPGNDESQLDRGQGFLIGLGHDESWGLAVFAYRGYDSSDGKSGLADLSRDAPEILARFCAAEGVPPNRVHIVGFSIGGYFAVRAAGGAAERGQRAASLTLLASVNDIVMVPRSPWEQLSPGDDYQTAPLLGPVPAPVLVVQGDADGALKGAQQGRDIARALGSRAEYHELAGVDHVPLLANAQALELVRSFVRKNSS
jgi:pimeloyl-ACP methyl ester carboxylesterase